MLERLILRIQFLTMEVIAKIMLLALKQIDSSRCGYLVEHMVVKVKKVEADKTPAFLCFIPKNQKIAAVP